MRVRHVVLAVFVVALQLGCAASSRTGDARCALVPRPAVQEDCAGSFALTDATQICVEAGNAEVRAIGEYLAETLRANVGQSLDVRDDADGKRAKDVIVLATAGACTSLGQEGYELTISPSAVRLSAPQACGLFRGVQTIRQMIAAGGGMELTRNGAPAESISLPCVHIADQPRYPWRGMLLDCCRHYMSKAFVKRYIDLLAYHKMNVLHWHLTEDQGWRIEIKKCPKLTEVGAWRGTGEDRYGGLYTQEDVREIVAYAASRYITVVPEIEMPGHALAALASYPELGCVGSGYEVGTQWGVFEDVYCAGNDRVFAFLEDVLTEVIGLFPGEYIHIGGDECPKARWKACSKCQARMRAEGLRDEHELQSYFIRRIEAFLNSKGRRLIGWDEILEGGLAPNATVQSWRGMDGAIAAARSGHDVISSPTSHCYLDYGQSHVAGEAVTMGYIPLERAYAFEPTPEELTPEQARHVLGLEGNLWSERAPQERVDWQVFPRLCALAEVGWSPKSRRDWDDFSRRMKTHYRRLDALGVTYFLAPPECGSQNRVFERAMDLVLENPLGRGTMRYTLDGSDPMEASPAYVKPVCITDTTLVRAITYLADGRSSEISEFRLRKLSPREPVSVPEAVPGLRYAYYEGSWRKLPDFKTLTAKASGVSRVFDLDVRKRDDGFAIRFEGFLRVPADGIYTFFLVSDDGSRLWIGDDLVVDHDGLHSASERSGQVILKAGMHPIVVAQFESGGGQCLEVHYAGPRIAKQQIPNPVLWQKPRDARNDSKADRMQRGAAGVSDVEARGVSRVAPSVQRRR